MADQYNVNKKVIFTFIIICFGYTFSLLLIGSLFGKEIAGYFSGLVIAFGTFLFKKLKLLSLSRKREEEKELSINIAKVNLYNILLVVLAYIGILIIVSFSYFYTLYKLGLNFDDSSLTYLIDNGFIIFSAIVINLVSLFLTGYLYGKTSNSITYLGAVLAASIIIVINTVSSILILLLYSVPISDDSQSFKDVFPICGIWIIYIAFLVLGSHLAFSGRKFSKQT